MKNIINTNIIITDKNHYNSWDIYKPYFKTKTVVSINFNYHINRNVKAFTSI